MIPRKYLLKDGSIYWHKLYFDILPDWMCDYCPPGGDYNYAAYLYQPHKYIVALCKKVIWFMQRGYRGYSDRDVWCLDGYITEWLPKALKALKKNNIGYPMGLTNHSWHVKLDKMINAFHIARKIQNYDYKTPKEIQAALKQFHKDFDVFKNHYFSLWD